jgi:hypothetical protein
MNRIEDLEINPHSHSHLILTKEQKSYIGEKAVSSINGKTGYTHLED